MKTKTHSRKKIKDNHTGWVLYTGMYEINWKNGKVKEVAIEGIILSVKNSRPARKFMA